jgi:hypothetical protein
VFSSFVLVLSGHLRTAVCSLSLVEQYFFVMFQLVLGLSERRSLLSGSFLLLYFVPAVVGRVFVEVVCVLYILCS